MYSGFDFMRRGRIFGVTIKTLDFFAVFDFIKLIESARSHAEEAPFS